MPIQPLQFGALTARQERLVERSLPGWRPEGTFSTNCLPGAEILDFMEQEGAGSLGEKSLSEDTFTPSDDFMTAEADLAAEYEDIGGDDDSPHAIVRRSQPISVLKQQAAGRMLALIQQSESFYVGDRLVQMLIQALQD